MSKKNSNRNSTSRQRRQKKSAGRSSKEQTPRSPLMSDGTLDWRQATLAPVVSAPGEDDIVPVRAAETAYGTFAAAGLALLCGVGLVFTGKWTLLAVALVAALLVLNKTVTSVPGMTRTAVVATLLSAGGAFAWRLVDLSPATNEREALALASALILIVTHLYVGQVFRRAASALRDTPHLQLGLYGLGAGNQALAVVLIVTVSLIGITAFA